MAVSIMSACCPAFVLVLVLLGCFLQVLVQGQVFMDDRAANQLLARQRRANSLFEEMKPGDMERECVEERCDWEEAREIFEDVDKTNEFWTKYVDGDACLSEPCENGGTCKDGIGSFSCLCYAGFQGLQCEIVSPELCENKNGGCEHFCHVVQGNVECSCADGYFLAPDDRSCHSNDDSSIGEVPPEELVYEQEIGKNMATMTRIVGGEDCPPGECPWQALLLNEDDIGFCGGTILNEYIILTAAHCMNQSRYIYIKLGEFDTLVDEGNEVIHRIETIVIHNKYKPETYHNDIALIKLATPIKFSKFILPACLPEQDFAEKVLMQQPDAYVSGFGHLGEGWQPSTTLQRFSVPYVDRLKCLESTQLRITTRMFCAGYDEEAKGACQGDSGGPHVTRYRGTYFVTGIGSWSEDCARKGKYDVYTQVSKYINWIREGINKLTKETSGSRMKRHDGPIKRFVL